MERNENGLSIPKKTDTPSEHGPYGDITMENGERRCDGCAKAQLAMVYAPMQCWRRLYAPADALKRGTLFEELYKPLEEV